MRESTKRPSSESVSSQGCVVVVPMVSRVWTNEGAESGLRLVLPIACGRHPVPAF